MAERKPHIASQISKIILVGTGGTGSYLGQGLAKMVAGYKLQTEVLLVDPDNIEEKNTARQNFQPWEIGLPKAEALAYRLNQQYGTSFGAVVGKGEQHVKREIFYYPGCRGASPLEEAYKYTQLIITCVDSVSARKHYHNCGPWLDIGNGETTGQALYGTISEPKHLEAELAKWDTSPTVGHLPNAWLAFNLDSHKPEKKASLACADQPFAEQGVFVNEWAAAAGLAILHQLLVIGTVTTPAIYFDAAKGRMSPQYITRESLTLK